MSNINDNKKLWHRLNPDVGVGTSAWRAHLNSLGFFSGSIEEDTKAMLLDGGHWVGNMTDSLSNFYSPELTTNGSFTTDLSGWVAANWTWVSGSALHSTGFTSPLSQTILTVGVTYEITYKVTGATVGTVRASAGSTSHGSYTSADGVVTETLTAGGSNLLLLTPSTDFDGAIAYIAVREML